MRSNRRAILGALVPAALLVAVAVLLLRAARSERSTGDGLPARSPREVFGRPAIDLPTSPEAGERQPIPSRAEPPGPPSPAPDEGLAGALDGLVARLEEIDARSPDTFHREAAGELERFVATWPSGELAAASPGGTAGELLLERIDALLLAPRVEGALLALAGAWGLTEAAVERATDRGELLRSALTGSCWEPGGTRPPTIELRMSELLEKSPVAGRTTLDLPLGRPLDEALRSLLTSLVLDPALDLEPLVTRQLSVVALGTMLDTDPAVLALFRSLLLDPAPQSRQIRPALVFALSRARGEASRRLLLDFVRDPQVGSEGKLLARWWMGERPVLDSELDELVQPLFEPHSTTVERMSVTGLLLTRVKVASEDELQQIVEVLCMRIAEETQESVLLASLSALAEAPGGWNKLTTLERVLRESSSGTARLWAAYGLSRLEPELRGQAESFLRTALGYEADERVRRMILDVLAETEGGDG